MAQKYDEATVRLSTGESLKFGKGKKILKRWLVREDGTPYGVEFLARTGDVMQVTLDEFPAHRDWFAVHGMSQKFGDAYASADSVEECLLALSGIVGQVRGGDWAAEGGGAESLLALACAEAFDVSPERARAILKEMSQKERDALKVTEPVKAIYDRMAAARAPKIDTEQLAGRFK